MTAPTDLRERLLASYADRGEAMVVENVLQTQGIPCRAGDLDQLPTHALGLGGTLGRSVGLWVLEADLERARAALATLGAPEHAIDEEALAAEALASAPPEEDEPDPELAPAAAAAPPPGAALRASRAPAGAIAAVVAAAALMLLVARACG